MQKHKHFFRFAFILSIILSIFLCPLQGWFNSSSPSVSASGNFQITFEPQITPIQYHTHVPSYFSTLSAKPDEFILDQDEYFVPFYLRLDCLSIDDDVCFGLCFADVCEIYGNDDDRVTRFVDLVEKREEKVKELELILEERGSVVSDAVGTCVVSGSGAFLAYAAIVGLTAPEPVVSKILGGVAAIGSLVVCGGAIHSSWKVEELRMEQIVDEIESLTKDAVFEFQSLQEDPP